MFKVSKRLSACAGMVSKGSRIVDVGTDHAYLPIYLAKNNLICKAIASDINIEPINVAKRNILKSGLEDIIETRISSGLDNIGEHEVDEVIISGMGGILISQILENCNWKNMCSKRFILQPMIRDDFLRHYLCENGYITESEKVVFCKGQIYTVMAVKYCGKRIYVPEYYYYIGKILKSKDRNTVLYIQKQIRHLVKKKNGSKNMQDFDSERKYSQIVDILKSITKEMV